MKIQLFSIEKDAEKGLEKNVEKVAEKDFEKKHLLFHVLEIKFLLCIGILFSIMAIISHYAHYFPFFYEFHEADMIFKICRNVSIESNVKFFAYLFIFNVFIHFVSLCILYLFKIHKNYVISLALLEFCIKYFVFALSVLSMSFLMSMKCLSDD